MLFQRKQAAPKPPAYRVDYPQGVCIKTEVGYFYVLTGKQRLKITSDRIRESWAFPYVCPSTEKAAAHMKVVGTLGFRAGTHIIDVSNGKHYIIGGNKKRHIMNPDVWKNLGFDPKNAIVVAHYEAILHEDGEVLA